MEQMFRQFAFDIETHCERSGGPATGDFPPDADADHVMGRMGAHYIGGRTLYDPGARQQALHCRPLGICHLCRGVTAPHFAPPGQ